MSTRPAFLFGGFCGKAIKEDAVLRDFTRPQPRNAQLPKYQNVGSRHAIVHSRMRDPSSRTQNERSPDATVGTLKVAPRASSVSTRDPTTYGRNRRMISWSLPVETQKIAGELR